MVYKKKVWNILMEGMGNKGICMVTCMVLTYTLYILYILNGTKLILRKRERIY